jgi:hypothetical protein
VVYRVWKGNASIALRTTIAADLTATAWSLTKTRCAAHQTGSRHPQGQRDHVVAAPCVKGLSSEKTGTETVIATATGTSIPVIEGTTTDGDDRLTQLMLDESDVNNKHMYQKYEARCHC